MINVQEYCYIANTAIKLWDNIRNLCKSLDCAQYKPQMVVNKIFLFNQSTANFKYFFENSVILNL